MWAAVVSDAQFCGPFVGHGSELSVDEIYFQIEYAKLNNIDLKFNAAAICASISSSIEKVSELDEKAVRLLSIASKLQCSTDKGKQKITKLIASVLGAEDIELESLANAVRIIDNNRQLYAIDAASLQDVPQRISDLQQDDGSFLPNLNADEGTTYFTGQAFHALGILKKLGVRIDWSKLEEQIVSSQIAKTGIEAKGTLYFVDEELSDLRTTHWLLSGAAALGVDLFTKDNVAAVSKYLQNSIAASIEECYEIQNALLSLISTSKTPVEIAVDSLDPIQITLFDLLGRPITEEFKVQSKSSKLDALDGATFTHSTSNWAQYSLKPNLKSAQPGYQSITLKVSPADSDSKYLPIAAFPIEIPVVSSSARITGAVVAVTPTSTPPTAISTIASEELPYGDKFKRLKLEESQHLWITIDAVEGPSSKLFYFHQTFVRFEGADGFVATFNAGIKDKKGVRFHLTPAQAARGFENRSGEYTVRVLCGDPFVASTVEWEMGIIEFEFSGETLKPVGDIAAPFVPVNYPFKPLPKPPMRLFTMVFIAAVFATVAVLLGALFLAKVLINQMPRMYGLVFFGCLGAAAAVLVLYWLHGKLTQTVVLLAIIGVPASAAYCFGFL